ncbi:MAG: Crp/Fnr family transcriptional regulator [Bacteroidales bacterium]
MEELPNADLAPCFYQLNEKELNLINKKKTQIIYQKGESLFKQGAFAHHVLYVIEGLVKVYLQPGGKRNMNLSLAKQGDFLGFSSVFGNEFYTCSASALRESRVCMIDKHALKQVLMTNSAFALQITSRNYKFENQLLEIIKNLSYKQMQGKLASALCYLSLGELEFENVFESLTRQELADFAGITQESVVKFLKEFEREGLVKLSGKNIQIVDLPRLQMISKNG